MENEVQTETSSDTELVTQHIHALTKYERARIIGQRARMIGEGAPVYVDVKGMDDDVAMATKELYAGKCPLIIRRFHPDHTTENPKFSEHKVSTMRLSEDWNIHNLG